MNSMLKMNQVIFLALVLFYGAADSATVCTKIPAAKIINSLSLRLEQMIETQDNYFFSPLSISIALGLVYLGARGNTGEQMAEALKYDIVGKHCLTNKVSEGFKELIQLLQSQGNDYKLLIANGAFLQKDYEISRYYSSSLEKFFNSKVQLVNFAEEEIAAMEKINEWVANYTQGKILQLFVQPLSPLTLIALVNAVYFKGFWDIPFDPEDTENGTFYGINNSEKTVPFMITYNHKFYNYYDPETKYSFIELDYAGSNVSMILVLPSDKKEFPKYELTSAFLCFLRKKFQYTPMTLIMPKFKLEFKRELSKDMINMGMTELFSDRADLSGIQEDGGLHVSLMMHKAIIEVNEKGSEASSITAIEIDGRKKIAKSDVFVANHPFQFYIIHRDTNTILFSGRVVDP